MTCTCGNHEFIERCITCKTCDPRVHIMVHGINWGKTKNEPCPHHCSFTMPNNQTMKYNCTLLAGHNGGCNFGVDIKSLSRTAKDMRS